MLRNARKTSVLDTLADFAHTRVIIIIIVIPLYVVVEYQIQSLALDR